MFLAVVPAYNEGKTIGSVIRSLFSQVDKVVVVDDGSTDATMRLAQEASAVVLHHSLNRGQGAALQTGHEYALKIGADYVLDFDADGQFSAVDIAPALAELKKQNVDILFGSRFLDVSSQLPWTKKYLLLPWARFFQRLFWGVKLSDVHNGFRLYRASALTKIHITQDRMAHATEIVLQAHQAGLKIIEFPVKVVYHEYGQGVGGGWAIIKDLFTGKFLR